MKPHSAGDFKRCVFNSARHLGVIAMHIVRWIFVIPIAIVGWFAGALAGTVIHLLGESLCPKEFFYYEMCHAPWSPFLNDFSVFFGVVTAACLVVLLPTLTAPFYRSFVAVIAYIIGLLIAVYFAAQGADLIWPAIWAAVGGGITLWLVHRALTLRSGQAAASPLKTPSPAVDPAPFDRWTLRDKAVQRR